MRDHRSLRILLLSSLLLAGLLGAATCRCAARCPAGTATATGPRGTAAAGPAASRSERAGGAGCGGEGQHLRHGRGCRVRSACAQGARQPVGQRRRRRRPRPQRQHDDGRDGPIRLQRSPRGPVQPVGLQARPRGRDLRAAPGGPAGYTNPARRRPEPPGSAADHAWRRDHRHRARRKCRGHSRHARARASLRDAEWAAHAAIGRERSDRRPRRVPHLRAAARRVRRVRHAAEHQSRPRGRPSGGVAATPAAISGDGAAGGGPGAGGYAGAPRAGSIHAAGVDDRRCQHRLRPRLLSGHDDGVERRDGDSRTW